jgi:transcriptional regulator with XRE-family HTH domain
MSDGLRETFAKALRESRRANGLSQAEVAERIGIAVEAYGRLERGTVLPRAETLVGLAHAFHVSTDKLLGVNVGGTAHDAAVARDGGVAPTDPEWRRIKALLDGLSPRTRKLLVSTLQAIREDADRTSAASSED